MGDIADPKWERQRQAIIDRAGGQCQIQGTCCTGDATTVDCVEPPHGDAYMRASCEPCTQPRPRHE